MRLLKSTALRAFESAARHLSFKLAAQELFVSPTAISHQIKALETDLNCRLFERKTRQVKLTREGQELFETVNKAFDDIDKTTMALKSRHTRNVVTLGLGPIIGTRWLAPRLGNFWAKHPDIDLRLHHTPLPMQLKNEQFDLTIEWGDGHWPGRDVTPFIKIALTPVMAPQLAGPKNEAALLDYPLIHQRDQRAWQQWFAAANVESDNVQTGIVTDDANLALQAAIDGQGVALGVLPFVDGDIISNKLIRPFELSVDPEQAYYLISRADDDKNGSAYCVKKWLLEQITEDTGTSIRSTLERTMR